MGKSGKRLFAVYAGDLSPQICTGKQEETDKIIVFTYPDAEAYPEEVSGFLADKYVSYEVPIDNTAKVVETIREHMDRQDKVYLVGPIMKALYEEVKDLLQCSGSAGNANFAVGKIPLYKPRKAEIPMDGNNLTLFEMPVMGMQKPKSSKPPRSDDRKESRDKKPEKRDGKKDNKKNDSPEEVNIQDLESAVFGSKGEETTFTETYSSIQNAKASLVAEFRDRLNEHICLLTKKKLDVQQAFHFSILLLKTVNPDNFVESWNSSEPTAALEMDKNVYVRLRSEAAYFSRVSEVLYGEDIFDY